MVIWTLNCVTTSIIATVMATSSSNLSTFSPAIVCERRHVLCVCVLRPLFPNMMMQTGCARASADPRGEDGKRGLAPTNYQSYPPPFRV